MTMIEPSFASGNLHLLPVKPRPTKKGKIKVGENYECCPSKKQTPWKFPFIGNVEAINSKSAVVKIIATQEEDDYLIDFYKNKTVIPLRHMKVVDEVE